MTDIQIILYQTQKNHLKERAEKRSLSSDF